MIIATIEQLERTRAILGHIPGATERAMMRALNRAITTARTKAIEKIIETYAIDRASVDDIIHIRQASPGNLSASVTGEGTAIPTSRFPHTPDKLGTGGKGKPPLRAQIRRGQMTAIPGAFIAPGGGRGGKGRNAIVTRAGKERMPIKTMRSIPIPVMLGIDDVREYVEQEALAMLEIRLAHEIEQELNRLVP